MARLVEVWGLKAAFDPAPVVEGWRFAGTQGRAPGDPDFVSWFAFSDGPDFSEGALVPADAASVTLQTDLTWHPKISKSAQSDTQHAFVFLFFFLSFFLS